MAATENVAVQATVVAGTGLVYGSLNDLIQMAPSGLNTASIWVPSQNRAMASPEKIMTLVAAVMAQSPGSNPMATIAARSNASISDFTRATDGQLVLTLNYN